MKNRGAKKLLLRNNTSMKKNLLLWGILILCYFSYSQTFIPTCLPGNKEDYAGIEYTLNFDPIFYSHIIDSSYLLPILTKSTDGFYTNSIGGTDDNTCFVKLDKNGNTLGHPTVK